MTEYTEAINNPTQQTEISETDERTIDNRRKDWRYIIDFGNKDMDDVDRFVDEHEKLLERYEEQYGVKIRDETLFKEQELPPTLDILLNYDGLDIVGGLVTRGVCKTSEDFNKIGLTKQTRDIVYQFTPEEIREAYRIKNSIATLSQDDLYSFWLLDRAKQNIRGKLTQLFGNEEDQGNKEIEEQLNNQYNMLFHRYVASLSHAVVREYLHFESKDFKEGEFASEDESIRKAYEALVRGDKDATSITKIGNRVISLFSKSKKSEVYKDNPVFVGNEGWTKATSLLERMNRILDDPPSRQKTDLITNLIDETNTMFHSSAAVLNNIIDQSRSNKAFIALCESFMTGDNLDLIFSQSPTDVKELFLKSGGSKLLLEEQDSISIGTDQYYEKLIESIMAIYSTREHLGRKALLRQLAREISETRGDVQHNLDIVYKIMNETQEDHSIRDDTLFYSNELKRYVEGVHEMKKY